MTFPTLDSPPCDVLVLYAHSDAAAFSAEPLRLTQALSAEEQARCARFRFVADQRSYAVAHALLRRALSAQTSLPGTTFGFVAGEHGRPELDTPPSARELRFNLSHTRGLVACALTRRADIGVDVEAVERRTEIESVGPRVFSSVEWRELRALPATEQRARFFDLWTLKEAYIKAIGQGLSAPLRSITFSAAAPDPVPLAFGPELADDASSWCVRRHVPGPTHRIALVFRGHAAQRVRFVEVGAEQLLTA